MSVRKSPKISALVVNAIRRLQDVQGSTTREISNYIAREYDVPGKDIRRQVHLALRRGVSYGILQRIKGSYYVCNGGVVVKPMFGEEMVREKCKSRGRSRKRMSHRSRGGKRKCGCGPKRGRSRKRKSMRKSRRSGCKTKSRSRRRSRGRSKRHSRGRSRGHSKKYRRSCGGRKRSRGRSRKRSCVHKRPRKCSDMENSNKPRSHEASLSGSRQNSKHSLDGSTISGSSDGRDREDLRDDPENIEAHKGGMN